MPVMGPDGGELDGRALQESVRSAAERGRWDLAFKTSYDPSTEKATFIGTLRLEHTDYRITGTAGMDGSDLVLELDGDKTLAIGGEAVVIGAKLQHRGSFDLKESLTFSARAEVDLHQKLKVRVEHVQGSGGGRTSVSIGLPL